MTVVLSSHLHWDHARSILATMWLIRAFEEKVSELYARGKIAGLLHLGIGQEAVAVGANCMLNQTDFVFGGHRAHGHAIAKGANPAKLMAELAGRTSGYCEGKGGSMHIAAVDAGFVTSTGVVGGNIPLALGGALASQAAAKGQVAMVFFGDGAGQTGAFHESLNIAALWKLPLVFICENNGYAEFSPLSAHTVVKHLADYAAPYGIPRTTVDGNDVLAVREAVAQAVHRGRNGNGPSFVECRTYRLRGHYEGDPAKYRELSELDEWISKDPIRRFESHVKETFGCSGEGLRQIETDARDDVERAARSALDAPWPNREDLTKRVLAGR